jgi:RNA polymerase sigma factor (sigma-70 family)
VHDTNPFHALTPSQLLFVSQSDDPNAKAARDAVVNTFGRELEKLTARVCRRYFLQHQEREDVLAETYQLLLNPDIARFLPNRGTPESYFRGLVQNAARKVMAQRDARRRKGAKNAHEAGEAANQLGKAVDQVAPRPVTPLAPLGPAEKTEQHDTVKYVLDQASPRVRRALEHCYWGGWSIQSIACPSGQSRGV